MSDISTVKGQREKKNRHELFHRLVISLDLIRAIVKQDRRGDLRRLRIEDASYGFYLHQLATLNLTGVTLQDLMEENFAMDAKCCTEQSHPNNCWSPLKPTSWLVHHMQPQQMVCMFRKDVDFGLYVPLASNVYNGPLGSRGAASGSMLRTWRTSFGGEQKSADAVDYDFYLGDIAREDLADLCGCVYTPPPHPDAPTPSHNFVQEPGQPPRLQPHVRNIR